MHLNNGTCTIEILNLENLGVPSHVTVERSTQYNELGSLKHDGHKNS